MLIHGVLSFLLCSSLVFSVLILLKNNDWDPHTGDEVLSLICTWTMQIYM